jgi:hypothetical protein
VEVEVEGGQPLLVGDVKEAGAGLQSARIVDQGVDPAVLFERGGDYAVGCGGVGEVGLDGGAAGAETGVDRIAASPIPEAAPVTTTIFSVSCRSMVLSFGVGSAVRPVRRTAGSREI